MICIASIQNTPDHIGYALQCGIDCVYIQIVHKHTCVHARMLFCIRRCASKFGFYDVEFLATSQAVLYCQLKRCNCWF